MSSASPSSWAALRAPASGAALAHRRATPTSIRRPVIPAAPAVATVRPWMRALGAPVLGTVAHALLRSIGAKNAAYICVRTHSNCFFFRDGELREQLALHGTAAPMLRSR